MTTLALKNTWVLVTGAAAGIGRETALAFARRGANLVVCDVDAPRLDALRKDLLALNVQCLARSVDVASEAAVQALADEVIATVGTPSVVVNNAGVAHYGAFLDTPIAEWDRIWAINVKGVVHGCRSFLPPMLAAGGPRRLINVASAAGYSVTPYLSAYIASKHAVLGLSETLMLELDGRNVTVTAICPGIINTQIISDHLAVASGVRPAAVATVQAYYKSDGCSPSVVAESIVAAAIDGRPIVLVGPMATLTYHLRRLSRALSRRLTLNEIRKRGFI